VPMNVNDSERKFGNYLIDLGSEGHAVIRNINNEGNKMDKKTTNQVRQILMNELGLTRESIRDEVKSIVRETVNKYLNQDGVIQRTIEDEVASGLINQAKNNQYEVNPVRTAIFNEAEKQVREFLGNTLKFSFADPGFTKKEAACGEGGKVV
jgi:hypothetical protein